MGVVQPSPCRAQKDEASLTMNLLDLTALRVARRSMPTRLCGIYFLFDGDELVYIGQSRDIVLRLFQHSRPRYAAPAKRFTTYAWVECEPDELNALELAYLAKFRPALNTKPLPGEPGKKRARPLATNRALTPPATENTAR